MQAVYRLTLFDPELATNKLFPSAAGQTAVACVNPAQRENARPAGLVPTRKGELGTWFPMVTLPELLLYAKPVTVLSSWFAM
jgi:hypothetical protein